MYILTVERSFDAAHKLEDYHGKCANLHGHTWKIVGKFEYRLLKEIGYALDFSELKKVLNTVVDNLDHTYLNDLFDFNPTAEQLAKYIYGEVKKLSEELVSITVYETPTNKVEYYENINQ